MLKISCPSCKADLRSDEYNVESLMAQCVSCDTVFRFDAKEALTSDKSYKQVEKPKGIEVVNDRQSTELIIEHKYFKSNMMFLILSVIISAIMVKTIFMTLSTSHVLLHLKILPFSIPLFLFYVGLNTRLKKTTLRITTDRLNIDISSPISFKNYNRSFEWSNINQLFVRRRKIESDESTSIVYDLGIDTKNGVIEYPLKNYKDPILLYFVETKIEELLGIEDKTHKYESPNLSFLPQSLSEVKDIALGLYRNRKK